MVKDSNIQAFFEQLKAGLWSDWRSVQEFNVQEFKDVDWERVYQLAQEQSVQGVVLRGIEELRAKNLELSVPRVLLLQWIGEVQVIEQQNKDMNVFIADLIEKLRKADVYAILVKGQGVAQCYERPLWRCSGDVDLLLSSDNYEKASYSLDNLTGNMALQTVKDAERKHREYQIEDWSVELHGTMHTNLSKEIDKEIDRVQQDVFCGGKVRSVEFKSSGGSKIQVFLPAPDEDVIFVFTHILQHLFLEGIGLRQICDWCRLLWTYKDSLNYGLLESRIKAMGLMTEWKAFGAFAVKYLGMNPDAVPFLGSMFNVQCSMLFKKADRLMCFILEVGNFGHNREVEWSNGFKRRTSLIWHRITDTFKLSFVFPLDAPKFLLNYAVDGVRGLMRW